MSSETAIAKPEGQTEPRTEEEISGGKVPRKDICRICGEEPPTLTLVVKIRKYPGIEIPVGAVCWDKINKKNIPTDANTSLSVLRRRLRGKKYGGKTET